MHKYTHNRPSRSSRSIGVSYITVTRKHSSRRLCTQLGRATLDLMFNSQITTTRPIRVFFCYKVGPPTSVLNWYVILCCLTTPQVLCLYYTPSTDRALKYSSREVLSWSNLHSSSSTYCASFSVPPWRPDKETILVKQINTWNLIAWILDVQGGF